MVFLRSIALSAGLLLGCHPPQSLVQDRKDSGFVYAEGTDLKLDGKKFYFVGVNVCGLANDNDVFIWKYGSKEHDFMRGENPDDYLATLFNNLKSRGLSAVRFCAFQNYTDGGRNFSSLDRVVRSAEESGMKLIPVLGNQWDFCPGDFYKYGSWYAGGYLEPQGEDALPYKEYVRRVVSRYRDSPAILMWQLMNEAESRTREGVSDPDSLYGFSMVLSRFVKSLDPNHLVSLGTIGTGQPGTQNENFAYVHKAPTVDIVETHDYHYPDKPWHDSPRNSVGAAYLVSLNLHKPFFIGEAGIKAGCDGCPSIEERAELFEDKIEAAFSRGVDGYLIWKFENSEYPYGSSCSINPLCFTEKDPLMGILEMFSVSVPRS